MEKLEINTRLVDDAFRKAYNRPFYTWECDEKTKKQHLEEYKEIRAKILEEEPQDYTPGMISTPEEGILYRVRVIDQLIIDLENDINGA